MFCCSSEEMSVSFTIISNVAITTSITILVVIYKPFLYHLGQTIRKDLFLLYQDEEVKHVFTPAPFVSFRTARTLRTHLVRAKVYPAEERLVGPRKCLRNRCQVCNIDAKQTLSKILWAKRFIRSITDLHVVISV